MNIVFLLGPLPFLSFTACEQVGFYTNPSSEIDTYKSVITISKTEQENHKDFKILDIPKTISDLNELKAHSKNISKR
ncbi:hypothetical protein O4H26_07885 [Aequorivita viscosa]|nr:hypothetical protein [Aequorivita viscosa]